MALTSIAGDAGTSSKTRDFGPVTWVVVVVATIATLAFALVVANGGTDATGDVSERTATVNPALPQGSPDSIERRALAEPGFDPATRPFVDRGSIAAIDHAASAPTSEAGFDSSTAPFVEQGSITAIDERSDVDG